jgi:hypothetical protein
MFWKAVIRRTQEHDWSFLASSKVYSATRGFTDIMLYYIK